MNILFDVDGVLIHGYHAKEHLRKCWDQNLENDFGIKRKLFAEKFIYGAFVKKVLVGKADLKDELNTFFRENNFKINVDSFVSYWMKNDSHVNHELLELVKELAKVDEVNLYIATNQEHYRAQHLMESLGFAEIFKDIFYAAKIGAIKPSLEYFQHIEDVLSSEQKIVFFDDSQKIIDQARQFGWEAHQFDSVVDLKKSQLLNKVLLETKIKI